MTNLCHRIDMKDFVASADMRNVSARAEPDENTSTGHQRDRGDKPSVMLRARPVTARVGPQHKERNDPYYHYPPQAASDTSCLGVHLGRRGLGGERPGRSGPRTA